MVNIYWPVFFSYQSYCSEAFHSLTIRSRCSAVSELPLIKGEGVCRRIWCAEAVGWLTGFIFFHASLIMLKNRKDEVHRWVQAFLQEFKKTLQNITIWYFFSLLFGAHQEEKCLIRLVEQIFKQNTCMLLKDGNNIMQKKLWSCHLDHLIPIATGRQTEGSFVFPEIMDLC